jgi:hypothetical protein
MSRNHQERIASTPSVPITAAAVTLMAFFAAAAVARSEDNRSGATRRSAASAHGWAGDGATTSGFHHPGNPPSLRKTRLTCDQIRMTIQCGRPGTEMRYFDRFAYTDNRCYGMTAAKLDHPATRRNRCARRLRRGQDQGRGPGDQGGMRRLLRDREPHAATAFPTPSPDRRKH